MNTSNKHWVETHAGRQSLSTKVARVLVILIIVASVAAAFLPAFHHSNSANQQMTHHICSSCGEEIPQIAGGFSGGVVPDAVKIAGGLSGGVVNDHA